jgi:hypothetical protein
MHAFNSCNNHCTGNPSCSNNACGSGWPRCDANNNDNRTVTVSNAAPTVTLNPSGYPSGTIYPDQPISVSANASDPDGNLTSLTLYLVSINAYSIPAGPPITLATITPSSPGCTGSSCQVSYSGTPVSTGDDSLVRYIVARANDACTLTEADGNAFTIGSSFTLDVQALKGLGTTCGGDGFQNLNMTANIVPGYSGFARTINSGIGVFSNVPLALAKADGIDISFTDPTNGSTTCSSAYAFTCNGTKTVTPAATLHLVIPNTVTAGLTYTATTTLAKSNSTAWFSINGGSMFGDNVRDPVCGTGDPVDSDVTGFKSTLIDDSYVPTDSNGWAFTNNSFTSIDTSNITRSPSGLFAQNLDADSQPFNDIWFQKYSEVIPTGAAAFPISDNTPNLTSGTIYTISKTSFNSYMDTMKSAGATITYSISGSNGPAILYINSGSSTSPVNIEAPILSNDGNGGLIIVTDSAVIATKNLGYSCSATVDPDGNPYYACAGMTAESPTPTIDALIISTDANDGAFETETAYPGSPMDKPIIFNGSVLSKGAMALLRGLNTSNDRYPAEYFIFNPNYLYSITHMDRNHQAAVSYSGLTTFDVQWDFVN